MRLLVPIVFMILFSICSEIAFAGQILWSDFSNGVNGTIRQADSDGTNASTLISGVFEPRGLQFNALDNTIYFSTFGSGKIQRANLDGSGVTDLVTGLSQPLNLTLDANNGHLYWASRSAGKIQRANLSGSGLTDLVTGFKHT